MKLTIERNDKEYEIDFYLDDDFWVDYLEENYFPKEDTDKHTIKVMLTAELVKTDELEEEDGFQGFVEEYFKDYIDEWIKEADENDEFTEELKNARGNY